MLKKIRFKTLLYDLPIKNKITVFTCASVIFYKGDKIMYQDVKN